MSCSTLIHVATKDHCYNTISKTSPTLIWDCRLTYHSHANVWSVFILLTRLFELKWAIVSTEHSCNSYDQLWEVEEWGGVGRGIRDGDKGMHMHGYVDTAMCAELIGRGEEAYEWEEKDLKLSPCFSNMREKDLLYIHCLTNITKKTNSTIKLLCDNNDLNWGITAPMNA